MPKVYTIRVHVLLGKGLKEGLIFGFRDVWDLGLPYDFCTSVFVRDGPALLC